MQRIKKEELLRRKKYILIELSKENIDEIIKEDLKNQGIDVENENINYLINIIKKILVDYKVYSRGKTIDMLIKNNDFIYSYIKEEKQKQKEGVRSIISVHKYPYIPLNDEVFDNFIISCTDRINNELNSKKLGYNI